MLSRCPGDEVVEPDDRVAVGEEAVGEVRAEESGRAGDQDPHARAPSDAIGTSKPSAAHLGGVVEVAAVDDHRARGALP